MDMLQFPPGVNDLSADMAASELIKYLKKCHKFLAQLDQEKEEEKELYLPFCQYISENDFLEGTTDQNVQMWLGSIYSEIFRIYSPKNPFRQFDKSKDILMFLTQQLLHLKNPKSLLYPKAFLILCNVAQVKSYNICTDQDTESFNEVFCQLFRNLFSIVNSGHDRSLKSHMLDIMSFAILEGEMVTQPLLDIVFECLLEKSQRLNASAYELARELLRKTSSVVEPIIMVFFQNAILGEKIKGTKLMKLWPYLLFELYKVHTSLVANAVPQLELKLKIDNVEERLQIVRVLSRMFCEKDWTMFMQFPTLWSGFLSRFNDIDIQIRCVCVNFCSEMIINHGEDIVQGDTILKKLTDLLRLRRHDTDESVREAVVSSLRAVAIHNLQITSDELLEFLKERLLDKKQKVREAAIRAVADIYKKYTMSVDSSRLYSKKLDVFKSQLLHTYYTQNLEDCILLERITVSSLIPYRLPNEDRMKRLLDLYCTVDIHAAKAIAEMFKRQKLLHTAVRDLLDAMEITDEEARNTKTWKQILTISTQLQSPQQACMNVKKFFTIVQTDSSMRNWLQYIVSENYTCQKVAIILRDILKKLDASNVGKNVRQTIQQMLERLILITVVIDPASLLVLIKLVREMNDCITDMHDTARMESLLRGLDLLMLMSKYNKRLFSDKQCFEELYTFLKNSTNAVVEKTLVIFHQTSSIIEENFHNIRIILLPDLRRLAIEGTPRQAKYAIYTINAFHSIREGPLMQVFNNCIEIAEADTPDAKLKTTLATLGCIAECFPENTGPRMKKFVASRVIKQIILKTQGRPTPVKRKKESKLCDKADVSDETAIKIAAIKCMVRWLCGLNSNDQEGCSSALRLLQHILHNDGDLMKCDQIPRADMAHLRLQAALSVLKLTKCRAYKKLISPLLFQELALLLTDEIIEVRRHFLIKLYHGLYQVQIPISFMTLFCMVSQEKVKEQRDHGTILYQQLVKRYREISKQNAAYKHSITPECILPYTIHLLARDPDSHDGVLRKHVISRIKECIHFILEPLLTRDNPESFGFIKRICEMIKRCNNKDVGANDSQNKVLYVICDLVLQSIFQKSSQYALAILDPPDESIVKFLPKNLYSNLQVSENIENYLPKEFQIPLKLFPNLAPSGNSSRKEVTQKSKKIKPSAGFSGRVVAVTKVASHTSKKNNDTSPQKNTSESGQDTCLEPVEVEIPQDEIPQVELPQIQQAVSVNGKRKHESTISRGQSSEDESSGAVRKKPHKANQNDATKNASQSKDADSISSPESACPRTDESASSQDSSATISSTSTQSSRPKRASAGSKMFDFLKSNKRSSPKATNTSSAKKKNGTGKVTTSRLKTSTLAKNSRGSTRRRK